MRNTIKYSFAVFLAALFTLACEQDPKIADIKPRATIIFDDDINKIAGTYFVAGFVNIKVSVDAGVSSINVSSRYTPGGATSPKIYSLGSFPVNAGVANFSVKARDLYDPADEQDNDAAALAAGKVRPIGNFVLLFDAVLSGGGTERRLFTATINNSVTFAAFNANSPTINPANSFNDSTITMRLTAQNPANARLAGIRIFRRIGAGAEEELVALARTYNNTTDATITDNFTLVIPPQGTGAGLVPVYVADTYAAATAANRTIRYRVEMTSSAGENSIFNTAYSVVNNGAPLPQVRTITLSPGTPGWDLSERIASTVESDRDLKLVASGTGFDRVLNLTVGAGNTTEFVRLPSNFSYAAANFNSVRDAYTAGSKVTTINSLQLNDNIAVRVGDLIDADPIKNRDSYMIFRVTNVFINTAGGTTDFVTFEYKATK